MITPETPLENSSGLKNKNRERERESLVREGEERREKGRREMG